MLYLVSTPIGNLSDITLRALETLKSCDYILCEDTRHSRILLNHYEIQKPLKSYHKFNEASQAQDILDDLRAGKQIALISDAGTPGISDPGAALVKFCVEQNIPCTAIPGPCAAIQAISCSGFSTDRFQFWGFLPRKQGELTKDLQSILAYPGTTICYESPHRMESVLELLQQLDPLRELAVARELTKKFEHIYWGTAEVLLQHWKNGPLKGEMVLLISPAKEVGAQEWANLSPQEHVQQVHETFGVSLSEAIKMVADLRQVPKREIYNLIHQKKSKT